MQEKVLVLKCNIEKAEKQGIILKKTQKWNNSLETLTKMCDGNYILCIIALHVVAEVAEVDHALYLHWQVEVVFALL